MARRVISIINLASVAALEDATGVRVHPLRFRGNFQVTGWPAWHEFDLLDREISIGPSARLRVVKLSVEHGRAPGDDRSQWRAKLGFFITF